MADSQQSQLALVSQCAGQDLAVQVLSVTCRAHPCAMHGGGGGGVTLASLEQSVRCENTDT